MLTGLIGGAGHGHGHVGSNLLGTALQGGMSLKTIGTYFPSLRPAAKKAVAKRKKKR